ncbi:MAG: bifunctional glutamate N-acetyltransferase/amino-acid acetyltransferase ArgJ [Victivallaceae bacterium]|nr:bifunctional glutamate N-acetyltransferase/amino-acid acetyltransferase ArgJ [Victivallaceae bacterium]
MNNTRKIENGSITSVPGFRASGVTAGFKRSGAPDFAMIVADSPCNCAGVFTSCRFAAAPVVYDRELISANGKLQAAIINSGIANACTGARGMDAAKRSSELAGAALGIDPKLVAVSSTGRIGTQLPLDLIERGIELAVKTLDDPDGGNAAARAIMTTDTVPKATALELELQGRKVTIGAMTKGAGMIDPKLVGLHATMLCYVATDAGISSSLLQEMLEKNAEDSFNRITVDGDMSTNDTVIAMANGKSGAVIEKDTKDAEAFQAALLEVMQNLARRMVGDGEGSTKLVTIEVVNAPTEKDAKIATEAVANSLLCKTAWFGNDPNWGRVVAALGYSGAEFDPDKCDVFFGEIPVVLQGGDAGTPEEALLDTVRQPEFTIRCDLHSGSCSYWMWSSDISYEYVKINADYHT